MLRKILSRNFLLPLLRRRRFVFVFHDVVEPGSLVSLAEDSMPRRRFEVLIDFIRRHFRIVPLERLVDGALPRDGNNYAAVTFDDGYASVREVAFPVLSRHGIPFTVFLIRQAVRHNCTWVSTVILNRSRESFLQRIWEQALAERVPFEEFARNPVVTLMSRGIRPGKIELLYEGPVCPPKVYLNAEDVLHLKGRGVRFGNHTADHLILSQCDEPVVRSQIREGRLFLEELLGERVPHFAIPFGKKEHYTPRSLEIAFEDHDYVYSSNPDPMRILGDRRGTLIPRLELTSMREQDLVLRLNRTYFRRYDI